jgi:hypothetical protein
VVEKKFSIKTKLPLLLLLLLTPFDILLLASFILFGCDINGAISCLVGDTAPGV